MLCTRSQDRSCYCQRRYQRCDERNDRAAERLNVYGPWQHRAPHDKKGCWAVAEKENDRGLSKYHAPHSESGCWTMAENENSRAQSGVHQEVASRLHDLRQAGKRGAASLLTVALPTRSLCLTERLEVVVGQKNLSNRLSGRQNNPREHARGEVAVNLAWVAS